MVPFKTPFRREAILLANGTDYDDNTELKNMELRSIYDTIREGAKAFLYAEYRICFVFIVLFGALVLGLVAKGSDMQQGTLTALSFAIGGLPQFSPGTWYDGCRQLQCPMYRIGQ